MDQLGADSLFLTRVEEIEVHSKNRAAAEGRTLGLLLESRGLDGECGRRQGHVPRFGDLRIAFWGQVEARERGDIRAGGSGRIDIDEQWP